MKKYTLTTILIIFIILALNYFKVIKVSIVDFKGVKYQTKVPVIGVTPDWDKGPTETAIYPRNLIRTNYLSSIAKYGATPIIIPFETDQIDKYIDLIDGLIVTGGVYDIDPSWYGEQKLELSSVTKNHRAEFEMKLIKAALNKKLPILTICAGEQLLAVIKGGKLYQDIKTFNQEALDHGHNRLDKVSHQITLEKNTLLYDIIQKDKIEVNSGHHQAVKSIGPDMIVSARSFHDGIIEAIELKDYPFGLGVQWHPECESSKYDSLILKAFVKAASD